MMPMPRTLPTTLLAAFLGLAVVAGGLARADEGPTSKKSEQAESPAPAQVGDPAPDFTLTDTEGNTHALSAYLEDGKTVILEWFNPDCPFVQKHHKKTRSMAETSAAASEAGVVWLAINSNAPGKQGNGLERNKKAVDEFEIAYPILLDEKGEVGKAYGAKTTPHMFVIVEGVIIYAGAIDDRPDAAQLGQTNYVRQCLRQLQAGEPVEPATTKPYGCSVKYAS